VAGQARDRDYPVRPFVVEAVLRCRARARPPLRGSDSGSGRRRPPALGRLWADQVPREPAGAG